MARRFRDREDAGRRLARRLAEYCNRAGVVVLGLAPGGVPIAVQVAGALGVPVDVFVTEPIEVLPSPELAIGVATTGNWIILNETIVAELQAGEIETEAAITDARAALERRERFYRGDRSPLDLRGRTVILVDDGASADVFLEEAISALREHLPGGLVVAIPAVSAETEATIEATGVRVVRIVTAESHAAVSSFYECFPRVPDAEVRELLERSVCETGPIEETPPDSEIDESVPLNEALHDEDAAKMLAYSAELRRTGEATPSAEPLDPTDTARERVLRTSADHGRGRADS